MTCLDPHDPLLARIREGRRTGALTLAEMGDLVDDLTADGHRVEAITAAAGLGCAPRRALAAGVGRARRTACEGRRHGSVGRRARRAR